MHWRPHWWICVNKHIFIIYCILLFLLLREKAGVKLGIPIMINVALSAHSVAICKVDLITTLVKCNQSLDVLWTFHNSKGAKLQMNIYWYHFSMLWQAETSPVGSLSILKLSWNFYTLFVPYQHLLAIYIHWGIAQYV